MLELAYIIVAIALVVFLVYLIITLQKVGRVIDETEKTVKTLTSDVDDLNEQARVLSKKASSAGSKTIKTGAGLSAIRVASKFFKK